MEEKLFATGTPPERRCVYLCRQYCGVHRQSPLLSGVPIPTQMLQSKTTEFNIEEFLMMIKRLEHWWLWVSQRLCICGHAWVGMTGVLWTNMFMLMFDVCGACPACTHYLQWLRKNMHIENGHYLHYTPQATCFSQAECTDVRKVDFYWLIFTAKCMI